LRARHAKAFLLGLGVFVAVRTVGGERNDIGLALTAGGVKRCLHIKFRAMTANLKIEPTASD
jgi:hypothetical protein